MEMLAYPFDSGLILKTGRRSAGSFWRTGSRGSRSGSRCSAALPQTTSWRSWSFSCWIRGIAPVFYQSEYAQYWQDAMFGNEVLSDFRPDIIFYPYLAAQYHNTVPKMTDTEAEVEAALDQQYRHFETMWEKLKETYHCPIIQNNFELPFYRLLGNRDASDFHGRTRFVTRLNERFYQYAQAHSNFYINDIHYLASSYGLAAWSDRRIGTFINTRCACRRSRNLALMWRISSNPFLGKIRRRLRLTWTIRSGAAWSGTTRGQRDRDRPGNPAGAGVLGIPELY